MTVSTLALYLPALVLTAGVGQLVLIAASLAIPRVLRWGEETAKLRPLTRQVFWTYAVYIWCTNLAFGLVSLRPDWLLDRSPLAVCVTGSSRPTGLGVCSFSSCTSTAPTLRRGCTSASPRWLVGLFLYLSLVYAAAMLLNLGVIGP
jgi:hypothetical protein